MERELCPEREERTGMCIARESRRETLLLACVLRVGGPLTVVLRGLVVSPFTRAGLDELTWAAALSLGKVFWRWRDAGLDETDSEPGEEFHRVSVIA